MLTQERLKELLRYEPETGLFYWVKARPGVTNGKQAGCLQKTNGYVVIRIDRVLYLAHRLAYFYMHGVWPTNDIDHKFGNRSDNRIDYIRDVTKAVNGQNQRKPRKDNKLGLLGVSKFRDKFHAQISINGKVTHIGYYNTPEEAHDAYIEAKRKNHEGNTL